MKASRAVPPRLVAMLLLCAATACETMKPLQPSQLSSQTINRVWVTRGNDSAIVLMHPEVRGDTLAGFVNGQYEEMPLSEARTLRAREPARGRTALLASAVAAAALGGLLYFENRSYVGSGEACSGAIQQQQQINLHCDGQGDAWTR